MGVGAVGVRSNVAREIWLRAMVASGSANRTGATNIRVGFADGLALGTSFGSEVGRSVVHIDKRTEARAGASVESLAWTHDGQSSSNTVVLLSPSSSRASVTRSVTATDVGATKYVAPRYSLLTSAA